MFQAGFLIHSSSGCCLIGGSLWNVSVCFLWACVDCWAECPGTELLLSSEWAVVRGRVAETVLPVRTRADCTGQLHYRRPPPVQKTHRCSIFLGWARGRLPYEWGMPPQRRPPTHWSRRAPCYMRRCQTGRQSMRRFVIN